MGVVISKPGQTGGGGGVSRLTHQTAIAPGVFTVEVTPPSGYAANHALSHAISGGFGQLSGRTETTGGNIQVHLVAPLAAEATLNTTFLKNT